MSSVETVEQVVSGEAGADEGLKWVWVTSNKTSFMRLFFDSSSSIVFSIVAMKDFLRSLVILACMRFRSRLLRTSGEKQDNVG